MSAQVHSFLESSVWDNRDVLRPVRQPVRFRIISTGKIFGQRMDHSFVSDFGVFFDPEDDQLITALNTIDSHTHPWHELVFWKDYSKGEIRIIDPVLDREIGKILVMRRIGGDPSGETDWTNVVKIVRREREN